MPQQRLTIELDRAAGSTDHWVLPLTEWPGFHLAYVADLSGTPMSYTLQNGNIVVASDADRLLATVDVDPPPEDIEAAKLEFERAKAGTEDEWRKRTYLFSIGSAVLTAIVTISVALIARPSHSTPAINVDAVHGCRDSLQRLSTLSQIKGQTVHNLATAIANHSSTCDAVLQGLIDQAAKGDSK